VFSVEGTFSSRLIAVASARETVNWRRRATMQRALTSPHRSHHRCQQFCFTLPLGITGGRPQSPVARVETFPMFVHWILVGIAIGIGLMLAPLVFDVGLRAIRVLIPFALIISVLLLLYAYWDAVAPLVIVALFWVAVGLPAYLLYLFVPACRSDKFSLIFFWVIALLVFGGLTLIFILLTAFGHGAYDVADSLAVLLGWITMFGMASYFARNIARTHLQSDKAMERLEKMLAIGGFRR